MKKVFLITSFLIFFSCNDGAYYQHFSNYSDYLKIIDNRRLTEKFSDIIKPDAFDIKSCSYIESNAFSKFNYSNNKSYDSIFLNEAKITFLEFDSKIKKLKDLEPNWFLDYDLKDSLKYQTIRIDHFYILRNKSKMEIFSFTSL